MSEIEQEMKLLIDAVKKSDTYQEYARQKNILKEDEELERRVNEYRRENYELQNAPDNDYNRERMEQFSEKYADFIELPKVSAFLDAELSLCRMMQELTARVVESLDFE